MELEMTTPALLFSAITLLLLAYTNRFLTCASLIRSIYKAYKESKDKIYLMQISNLRLRINLIKYMQGSGVFSFFLCVLCMLLLFIGQVSLATYTFGFSMLSLLVSLLLSLWEISISVNALNIQLRNLEDDKD